MKSVVLLLASVCLVSSSTIQVPATKTEISYEDHNDHDHDHDDHRMLDWWEKTVFYQIYPRSFKDSNGDGTGDLNGTDTLMYIQRFKNFFYIFLINFIFFFTGITSKLDHLKDLGIGATWLSPIFTSPMYDSGYDISDFYNINPLFGTMADFEELVSEADKLGKYFSL